MPHSKRFAIVSALQAYIYISLSLAVGTMGRLDGKSIIVSGAAAGFGRGVSSRMPAGGAQTSV